MLENLNLLHISENTPFDPPTEGSHFLMKTCQRTLLLYLGPYREIQAPYKLYQGVNAYQFLLETLCGLKSKLLGEYEILGQYKTSLQNYLLRPNKNPHLTKILAKILSDAKKIRGHYLDSIGQKTYAALARKLVNEKELNDVLIFGQGQLSKDIVHQFLDKKNIYLSARNAEKAKSFCKQYNISFVPWKDYNSYHHFPCLINCIGTKEVLFNNQFVQQWSQKKEQLFIDLGEPSPLCPSLNSQEKVIRLSEIYLEAQIVEEKKRSKIEKAQKAIQELTPIRKNTFTFSYPFGWDELQFA